MIIMILVIIEIGAKAGPDSKSSDHKRQFQGSVPPKLAGFASRWQYRGEETPRSVSGLAKSLRWNLGLHKFEFRTTGQRSLLSTAPTFRHSALSFHARPRVLLRKRRAIYNDNTHIHIHMCISLSLSLYIYILCIHTYTQ